VTGARSGDDRVIPSRLEAVVFDFDGVIIDSETPEYEAYRTLFEQAGSQLPVDEWTSQVGIWADDQDLVWHQRLCGRCRTPPTLEYFRLEKRRLFGERLPLLAMSGIEELLDALVAESIPIGIASSSPARWVMSVAARLGIAGRIQAIVTADDVAKRKPEPDVYLEALRRLGVRPACTVAIEDSGPGIAAALAAGLKTVVIPHWLTDRHDLTAAHLRVSSAADMTVSRLRALVTGEAGQQSVPIR
jgi:putative hydrolase of the HAD superfamily